MGQISLGSNENGVTLTWISGRLEINIWDSDWHEAAAVALNSRDALALAQWINEQLGRD